MFRGTTPTLRWKISSKNFNLADIQQVWVTIKVKDNLLLTKDIDDVLINSETNTISYTFSQEETLSFPVGTMEAQLRVLTKNGMAFATKIQKIEVNKILKGGVIS